MGLTTSPAGSTTDPTERGGYETTVTSAGVTTLTSVSKFMQFFTGTNQQSVKLPVASTLSPGFPFLFVNRSTQVISILTSAATGLSPTLSLQPGGSALVTCILTSGTTGASWNVSFDEITLELAEAFANSYTNSVALTTLGAAENYTDAQITKVPSILFDNISPVASVNTNGTEDDLFSNSILAGVAVIQGDKIIELEVVSTVGSVTAARRIRKYFDGNLIWDSGALTLAVGSKFFIQTIISARVDDGRCDIVVAVTTTSASTVPYVTFSPNIGVDFSGGLILKTTGTASGTGAASGDITDQYATISKSPAGAVVT